MAILERFNKWKNCTSDYQKSGYYFREEAVVEVVVSRGVSVYADNIEHY